MAEQRLTIEGLIEELYRVAKAEGPRGLLLPVILATDVDRERIAQLGIWLELEVRQVASIETGERTDNRYTALVITGRPD